MSDSKSVSREALLDRILETIEDIRQTFVEEDDDWEPIVQISAPAGLVLVPLSFDKSYWGEGLKQICEKVRANAVAIINSTWQFIVEDDDPERDEKMALASKIGVSNMEGRTEALVIIGIDETGIVLRQAEIFRHKGKPPTLGEFHTMKDAQLNIWEPVLEYFELKEPDG